MHTTIKLWTPTVSDVSSFDSFVRVDKKNQRLNLAKENLKNGYVEEAKSIFKQLTNDEGQAEAAHFWLGMIALNEKKFSEAVDYLEQADTAQAHYILGALYLKGVHGKKDNEAGIQHLEIAAEKGFLRAKVELGAIYYFGMMGDVDLEKANAYFRVQENWYNVPHISEHAHAAFIDLKQDSLAVFHLMNIPHGERRYALANKIVAKKHYAKDSTYHIIDVCRSVFKKNDTMQNLHPLQKRTCVNLGRYYYEDFQHYKLAIEYWKPAAEQGDMHAQYYLGLAYCSGKGVKKDLVKGKEFLKKAADAGFTPAQSMLNHLNKKEPIPNHQEHVDDQDLPFSDIEEKDCVFANKPFLGKAWTIFKRNIGQIAGVVLGVSIVAGIVLSLVGGAVALTVFFPHVMIPIWIIVGGTTLFGITLIVSLCGMALKGR
jgi:TPR repeat protein